MASNRWLSAPDPEWTTIASTLPSFALPTDVPLSEVRKKYHDDLVPGIKKSLEPRLPKESEYRTEDHHIPVKGGPILVRCYIPTPVGGERRQFPVMMWYHGGGWMLADIEFDDYRLRKTCVDLQISIVNVEYRLMPEHSFLTSVNDCYAAVKWAVSNDDILSSSPEQALIIAGSTAGANTVSVIAHRALEDPFFKSRPITGHAVQSPNLCHCDDYPDRFRDELLSKDELKDGPLVGRSELMLMYTVAGNSGMTDMQNPEIAPLLYPSHAGLPPLYIQICGMDSLRDEELLYERMLREAGVSRFAALVSQLCAHVVSSRKI
ncbi:hypothetical protein EWM64_g446 [Hericium alpestre]|uniref:Alpha/beta hydrolase fold-3 domain-containing protein n=1 Tax=Hericium alpestre TaxID=135208 RepID=A0A4Z0AB50_9AGAM|nr:hypothetical protein EWM64_g446 [Hericium alpestre]